MQAQQIPVPIEQPEPLPQILNVEEVPAVPIPEKDSSIAKDKAKPKPVPQPGKSSRVEIDCRGGAC